jgi:hypothetical protein
MIVVASPALHRAFVMTIGVAQADIKRRWRIDDLAAALWSRRSASRIRRRLI